jgi:hypothetical protein
MATERCTISCGRLARWALRLPDRIPGSGCGSDDPLQPDLFPHSFPRLSRLDAERAVHTRVCSTRVDRVRCGIGSRHSIASTLEQLEANNVSCDSRRRRVVSPHRRKCVSARINADISHPRPRLQATVISGLRRMRCINTSFFNHLQSLIQKQRVGRNFALGPASRVRRTKGISTNVEEILLVASR